MPVATGLTNGIDKQQDGRSKRSSAAVKKDWFLMSFGKKIFLDTTRQQHTNKVRIRLLVDRHSVVLPVHFLP